MKRTLLRCGWIVSVDDAVGDFTGGDILIAGDRIAAVGRDLAAEADEVIDARGLLAMPGLVNAHMHSWQTGFRNIGGDWMSADYFRNVHGTMGSLCGPEDNYLATLVGALDQINGGVTTLGDWCHNLRNLEMAERAIDGLQESGIRAVFFHGTAKPEALADSERDASAYTQQPHPRTRVEALRKGRLASDDALVTMALGVSAPISRPPKCACTISGWRASSACCRARTGIAQQCGASSRTSSSGSPPRSCSVPTTTSRTATSCRTRNSTSRSIAARASPRPA